MARTEYIIVNWKVQDKEHAVETPLFSYKEEIPKATLCQENHIDFLLGHERSYYCAFSETLTNSD